MVKMSERTAPGIKAAEDFVAPYVATVSAQASEGFKAAERVVVDVKARADARHAFAPAESVVAEMRARAEETVKPYVATVSAQASEVFEAAEKVVVDLRARADARAAFAPAESVVAEMRARAEQTVADIRKAVGL